MSSADAERREEDDAPEAAGGEEEDTGAQVAPIVRLEEVAVTTGEEDEDVLLDLKAKLYRFDKELNQWKERGTGSVKLLKHKVTGKVRLVMRQAKTLKICANHLVLSSMKVQEHVGNDKSCVWHANDFADGELKDEMFCIRFGSVENNKLFMEKFEAVVESLEGKGGEPAVDLAASKESESVSTAASELLEKLTVSGGVKAEEHEPAVEPSSVPKVDEVAEKAE